MGELAKGRQWERVEQTKGGQRPNAPRLIGERHGWKELLVECYSCRSWPRSLGGTWRATAVIILPVPGPARQADITVDCGSQKKIMVELAPVEFARIRSTHLHAHPSEHPRSEKSG